MEFKIREVALPILPEGRPSLRVLHFSDIHLLPTQRRAIEFIRSWSDLNPDLIISTGDHIASAYSIPILSDALGPLLEKPGFYVFGSNDYYGPKFKNPIRYLLPDSGRRIHGSQLPWKALDSHLGQGGWINLTHKIIQTEINGVSIELRGTDDAHLGLDNYKKVSKIRGNVDLSAGVTHAPYARVLDAMSLDQVDIIFAGHTHGGQIRLPWFGGTRSLTTNCDLPNWRSRGLSRIGIGPWLLVSSGLGTNPFLPFRILTKPEVIVVTLTTKSSTDP